MKLIRSGSQIILAMIPLSIIAFVGWLRVESYRIESILDSAKSSLQQADYLSARKDFVEYLQHYPNHPDANLLYAKLSRQAGYLEEADVRLDMCDLLAINPVLVQRERILLSFQKGELASEPEVWSLIDRFPEETESILEALTLGYRKNYLLDSMIRSLNLWLERNPHSLVALMQRGWVYERKQDYSSALADYRKAVELDPKGRTNRVHLGQVLLHMKFPSEAHEILKELVRDFPNEPEIVVTYSQALREIGEVEQAKSVLEHLAKMLPKEFPVVLEMGRIELDLEHFTESEKYFRTAIELSPYDYQAHFNLIRALQRQPQKKVEWEEKQSYLKKLEADLDRLQDLTDKLQGNPVNPDIRCEIGKIFLRNGEPSEGVLWLKGVLRLHPHFKPAHEALAEYYQNNCQPSLAASHRQYLGKP